jgi:ethanolamine ammonia-lyase large subunit
VPSQSCLAASAAAQTEALRHGAPVDVFFHALAGTEHALDRLGTSITALDEARALVQERGTLHGTQVMYLTISQGMERVTGRDDGVDQTTLAARALALARRYNPFLVESTTARLGAAALADSQELIRAGLEDHFIGKLLGVPMGALACGAIDTPIAQDDVESLSALLAAAGVNALAVAPGGADPVSGRSSSSLHDAVTLRQMLGLRPAPEFETWMVERGLMADGRLTGRAGDPAVFMRG